MADRTTWHCIECRSRTDHDGEDPPDTCPTCGAGPSFLVHVWTCDACGETVVDIGSYPWVEGESYGASKVCVVAHERDGDAVSTTLNIHLDDPRLNPPDDILEARD